MCVICYMLWTARDKDNWSRDIHTIRRYMHVFDVFDPINYPIIHTIARYGTVTSHTKVSRNGESRSMHAVPQIGKLLFWSMTSSANLVYAGLREGITLDKKRLKELEVDVNLIVCVLSLFKGRSQSVSDRLSAIDLYLTALTSVRAQIVWEVVGAWSQHSPRRLRSSSVDQLRVSRCVWCPGSVVVVWVSGLNPLMVVIR